MTVALPPPEDRALSDVWSALGGELKPSLDLVVISPFEAGPVDEAAKLVREGMRLNFAMSDHGSENGPAEDGGARQEAAISKAGHEPRRREAQAPDQRQGRHETVVSGTSDQKGRIFHLPRATTREGRRDGARRRPWRRRRLNDLTDEGDGLVHRPPAGPPRVGQGAGRGRRGRASQG